MEKEKIEQLLNDYNYCFTGYEYRDQLVPDEFSNLSQKFLVFATLMFAFNFIVDISQLIHYVFIAILFISGFLSMFAMLIDMQSNLSCKTALRNRCIEIEKEFSENNIPLSYWASIRSRPKYWEEIKYKGAIGNTEKSGRHGNLFVYSSRILILLWICLTILSSIYGGDLNLY